MTCAVGLLELQSDYKYWKQANWSASLCPNTATGTRGLAITLERRNLMRAPLYCLLTTRSLRRTFIYLFIYLFILFIYLFIKLFTEVFIYLLLLFITCSPYIFY